jgi:hypothetical protein
VLARSVWWRSVGLLLGGTPGGRRALRAAAANGPCTTTLLREDAAAVNWGGRKQSPPELAHRQLAAGLSLWCLAPRLLRSHHLV